ncbi:MAG: DinB family protein [bacterium]|nr:DinB family protein [bacterium]
MRRPNPDEYNEYYSLYINQVPEGDILEMLATGVQASRRLLGGLPEAWEVYRYEPGKWSLREVVGHVIDVERVFGYRALSMARSDPAHLPGMDQDPWAASSNAGDRPLASQLEDLERARASSIAMFESFDGETWDRRGTASGFEFTVRAFPYILAGHEIHHLRVLEERYLKPLRDAAA